MNPEQSIVRLCTAVNEFVIRLDCIPALLLFLRLFRRGNNNRGRCIFFIFLTLCNSLDSTKSQKYYEERKKSSHGSNCNF